VAQEAGINTEFSGTTEHTEKAKKNRLNAETRRPQRRARKDKSATESQRTRRRKKRELVMGGGFLVGGREFAELGDGSGDGFESVVDFGFGGVAAKAETDAGTGFVGGEADGGEDVRGFDCAGRASGAGRNADAFQIEGDDEGFAFDSGKSEIGCVRSARRVCGVDVRIGDARGEAVFEIVA